MKEVINVDIFDQITNADCLCITTNCTLLKDGTNPMGALAGQAASRWKEIPKIYGKLLTIISDVPVILGWINKNDHKEFVSSLSEFDFRGKTWCALVAFPTMTDINKPASFDLVIRSARLLVEMADVFGWRSVYMGSPGTGIGSLPVEKVHTSLKTIFDNRFTVMRMNVIGIITKTWKCN